jgi:RNase P subunit RPR2
MDFYLLAFMLIVLIGSVIVYIYYLKEKKEQLDTIRRGFCPQCKQDSIERTDERSSGCSGPKILTFECLSCGYINSFAVDSSDSCCSSGGCGI